MSPVKKVHSRKAKAKRGIKDKG